MYLPTGRVDLDRGLGDFDLSQLGRDVTQGVIASPAVYWATGKSVLERPADTLREIPDMVEKGFKASPGLAIGVALPAAALLYFLFAGSGGSSGRRRR